MAAAGMLEGKTLDERIAEGGRMFCIDYVAGDFSELSSKIEPVHFQKN
jgi:hypothetical protein